MLVIQVGCPVFMENNAGFLLWMLRIVDIPVMSRILRLDRHIIIPRQHDSQADIHNPLRYLAKNILFPVYIA